MPQKYQSGGRDSFQLKEMLIIGFTTSLTEESWTTKFYEIALDNQKVVVTSMDGPFLGRSDEFAPNGFLNIYLCRNMSLKMLILSDISIGLPLKLSSQYYPNCYLFRRMETCKHNACSQEKLLTLVCVVTVQGDQAPCS